jgi:hypothetical protein
MPRISRVHFVCESKCSCHIGNESFSRIFAGIHVDGRWGGVSFAKNVVARDASARDLQYIQTPEKERRFVGDIQNDYEYGGLKRPATAPAELMRGSAFLFLVRS